VARNCTEFDYDIAVNGAVSGVGKCVTCIVVMTELPVYCLF